MPELKSDVPALVCNDVEKVFPIESEGNIWRMMLGLAPRGRTFTALRDVSLTVPRGKIVGILGHNGAGKSTLLRILGGVYTATKGAVWVDGIACGLFELGGMGNRHLTGREYAQRYLSIMGVPRARQAPYIEDILEFSELGPSFDQRILTYSAGMGARLYFSTATALQHEIYLIDELLSVGDEHFQSKCWARMRKLLLNGASGILVTHDWVSVLRLCEQSHILQKGRLVASGPSDQMVVKYLDIALPDARTACFSPANAVAYEATAGRDTEFRFQIDVAEDGPVAFSYSIEMLRIGTGWEILLLESNVLVAAHAGRHEVTLRIEGLPLAPGEYSLNVGLSRYRAVADGPADILDSRSWTTGNGWKLTVTGDACEAAVRLPIEIQAGAQS
ncbi:MULTISPECIES: ABC transporter ATP-binding protein [Bordetella]|uniref:ABC transporter ATP-binding protein n=2 Tax=Bordetella parapertussis TaxID=519 RepID=K0MAF2_BORPB|nr:MULTISPECIES: ABC transporter ATP-binding protein [Bordetella]ABF72475.1 WbmN [Bordetella parapertussis]KAB1451558.1 ATP-binding cassette domain-containing protein [Bordetella bronchiseptica]KAB1576802.1 ATP-binding cassette domain-containing protein [Bordetella bronchiseptica]KDC75040.1 ABC transporter, ATP-binding protein [Bordetella bronchiseptica MBORD635]KDD04948.1 ABC transporter, ATP-binding protein [Bordetella bronchiseptica MBORD681]